MLGPSLPVIEKWTKNKLSFQKLRVGHSMSKSFYTKKVSFFRGGIKTTRNPVQKALSRLVCLCTHAVLFL